MLSAYKEERAPRQAEKETRFSAVDFLNKNANRLSAYKEERAPQQAKKETRFCAAF